MVGCCKLLLLRDFSAWYHIVIVIDTTLSTSNDRQKLYINGTQQTDIATSDPIKIQV